MTIPSLEETEDDDDDEDDDVDDVELPFQFGADCLVRVFGVDEITLWPAKGTIPLLFKLLIISAASKLDLRLLLYLK